MLMGHPNLQLGHLDMLTSEARRRSPDRIGDVTADGFDGSVEDVFDFQDKVAKSVAGIVEPAPVRFSGSGRRSEQ